MTECFIFDDVGGLAPEESGGGCDAGWPRFWHWYTCDGANGPHSGYWWVSMHSLVTVQENQFKTEGFISQISMSHDFSHIINNLN